MKKILLPIIITGLFSTSSLALAPATELKRQMLTGHKFFQKFSNLLVLFQMEQIKKQMINPRKA
jgi:hypothetical protein